MGFRQSIMAGAAALAGLLATGAAQAQNVQVGLLQCDVSGGVGLIIASQKELICNFRNSRGEYEVYTGAIRKFGLDIGATAGGTMAWSVVAPSGRISRGALAGVNLAIGVADLILVAAPPPPMDAPRGRRRG